MKQERTTWFLERRLDHIDLRLATAGEFQRAELVATFGVSMSQATQDINAFVERYPGAIEYDATARRYVPAGRAYRRRREASLREAAKAMGWDAARP